jgi:hypothetical protein
MRKIIMKGLASIYIRAKLPPIAFGGSEIRSAVNHWRPVQRGGLR